MPVRWLYPSAEYDYNKANVEAAVQKAIQRFGRSKQVDVDSTRIKKERYETKFLYTTLMP